MFMPDLSSAGKMSRTFHVWEEGCRGSFITSCHPGPKLKRESHSWSILKLNKVGTTGQCARLILEGSFQVEKKILDAKKKEKPDWCFEWLHTLGVCTIFKG